MQSLTGKLPVALAARARARGIPVAAVVGRCQLNEEDSSLSGFTQVRALDQLDSRSALDKELSVRLLVEIGSTLALPSTFIHSSLLMGMLKKLANKRKVE